MSPSKNMLIPGPAKYGVRNRENAKSVDWVGERSRVNVPFRVDNATGVIETGPLARVIIEWLKTCHVMGSRGSYPMKTFRGWWSALR